jgi:hypothetical protein
VFHLNQNDFGTVVEHNIQAAKKGSLILVKIRSSFSHIFKSTWIDNKLSGLHLLTEKGICLAISGCTEFEHFSYPCALNIMF